MNVKEFLEKAKELVRNYTIEHMDKTNEVRDFEISEVWHCYILGHQKALIATKLPDGMYYEVTYNSAKNEIYLDAYKKFENRKIELN